MNQQEKQVLLSEIRSLFDSYFKKYPNRNQSTFAKKIGIAESTVRRTFNSVSIPQPDKLVKILRELMNENRILSLIEKSDGEIRKFLESYLPNITDLNNYEFDGDIPKYLTSNPSEAIVYCISSAALTTRDSIKKLLGDSGVLALRSLIDNEILKETDGVITPIKDNQLFSTEDTAKIFPSVVKASFNDSKYDKTIFSLVNGLSVEGLQEVIDITIDARKKIGKVFENKKGELPVLSMLSVNSICFQSEEV